MRILAIETSCDETAAAVVEDGRRLLSNVVATQIDLHRRFGGVFPEVASRQHVLSIYPVIQQALDQAQISHVNQLDAIAVTHGPGLAGSLLVGVNAAKGMAFASGLPLLPVNHLEGHIYSNWIEMPGAATGMQRTDEQSFPALVLIVSGGHTELILMRGHGDYRRLGGTLDDAAGEAFDKVARLLGLDFPGGPAIQKAAQAGDATRFALPRALRTTDDYRPEQRFNFSFSGLKTAVLNLVRRVESQETSASSVEPSGVKSQKSEVRSQESAVRDAQWVADMAASFQAAVADQLIGKVAEAAREFSVRQVCICGGVSANAALRQAAQQRIEALGLPLYIPPLTLCTDNAAMIGAAAFYRWRGKEAGDRLDVDVMANLPLVEEEKRSE